MSQGMPKRELDDVCEVEYGTRVVHKRDGGKTYPVYGGGGATFAMDSFNRENRVVISRFGMSEQCTRYVSGKFFLNDSGLTLASKNPSTLQQEYINKWVFGVNAEIFKLGKGTAQKNLDVDAFRRMQVPIPPLSEQKRIVAVLEKAFSAIAKAKENTEKNLANARELFESHLQSIFTKSDSSHIPHQLDAVCKEITVGHVGSMAKQYKAQGVPFLRSQNIRPFGISLVNVVFIDKAFHKTLAKSQLRPGDVAVVRTGYPGTAAVIPDSLPVCNCSDLVIVRPGPAADPHYLTLFFNSKLGKKLVAGRLVGAAQKHFNVTAAKQVTISFPPIPEQRRHVVRIQALRAETQRLESIYQKQLAILEELKISILRRAFSGELAGAKS